MIQSNATGTTIDIVELVKGYSTGSKFQLVIENFASVPFDVRDTEANVSYLIQAMNKELFVRL